MSTPENVPGGCSIKFLVGPLAGQTFQITSSVTTIGRHSNNDIAIKSDLAISRQQALLVWRDGQWRIEKSPGAAEMLVNQSDVEEAILHHGDHVALGPNTSFVFVVEAAVTAAEEATQLDPTMSATPADVSLSSDISTQYAPGLALPPVPPPAVAEPPQVQSQPEPTIDEPMDPRGSRTLRASGEFTGLPSLKLSFGNSGERKVYTLTRDTITVG